MEKKEHLEQVGFVTWFRDKFPYWIIFAIPNGGFRNISVAKELKKEGVLKGIPDLQILFEKGRSVFIEMKAIDGRLSSSQKKIIPNMEFLGHKVLVCYGAEDASLKFKEYLKENISVL